MYSLIFQADYHNVSLGLCKGSELIQTSIDTKQNASKNLMLRILNLLQTNKVGWDQISYIGVNQGPAPFTTLRIVVTTANGLNFARKIPLVGVDGIQTFLQEISASTPLTVVLLNAFGRDVYFGIKDEEKILSTGWHNASIFLEKLKEDFPSKTITFAGNGVLLFKDELEKTFQDRAHILDPLPEYTSLKALAQASFLQWERKENVQETLLPLYLKTQEYKRAT